MSEINLIIDSIYLGLDHVITVKDKYFRIVLSNEKYFYLIECMLFKI